VAIRILLSSIIAITTILAFSVLEDQQTHATDRIFAVDAKPKKEYQK